jgi:hypothetical protein
MRTMMPSMTEASMSVSSRVNFEKTIDDREGHRGVDLENGRALQRVHVDDGQGCRVGNRADELLVGELIDRGDVDMGEAAQLAGQRRRGLPGESLVHDRDRADLVLRELVGPLEVVDLDLALIGRGARLLGRHLAG